MCQHERMTLEGEQVQDYAKLFCMSDSSSRVLHLVAEPLPKAGKKENKQEEQDGGKRARI
jgi:hypothetical protein